MRQNNYAASMNTYKIQQRIRSISKIMMGDGTQPNFLLDGVSIDQEHFTLQTGPTGDYWVAEGVVDAQTWRDALAVFITKVERITARTAFVSQGYVNFLLEPFLITRENDYSKSVGFLRFTKDSQGIGLSLLEDQRRAIEALYTNSSIPDDFFLYWSAASTTTDYASKLLLMFGAIEALGRARNQIMDREIKTDEFRKELLGENLAADLFAQTTGLRHQLAHGEYFNVAREQRNYLEEVHKAIVAFFNKAILKEELISEDVVAPQRHFDGNKVGFNGFIQSIDKSDLPPLKALLADFNFSDGAHILHSSSFLHVKEPGDF